MTIPAILKELEPYTGRFPKRAMQAAIEQREAISPELLWVLKRAAEGPAKCAEQMDYMLHVFAMYLLAQFHEKRAYRPLVKMFNAPGEAPLLRGGDGSLNVEHFRDAKPAVNQAPTGFGGALLEILDNIRSAFLTRHVERSLARRSFPFYIRSSLGQCLHDG